MSILLSNKGIKDVQDQVFIVLGHDAIPYVGSPAFVVLSNKEKAVRVGLVRQRTPTQCVRGETSLNAVLHWFLGGLM